MFAGVGERTREGNDLYKEMIESVRTGPLDRDRPRVLLVLRAAWPMHVLRIPLRTAQAEARA